MQFNDKSNYKVIKNVSKIKDLVTDISNSQTIISEAPLIPNSNYQRPCICQKVVEFCYCCGVGWLFDKPSSIKPCHNNNNSVSYMWCNSDICGSICALFTWLLILHPCFVLLFIVFIPVDSNYFRCINGFIFYFLALMAALSHIKSVFTDPGTVEKGNATEDNIKKLQVSEKPMIRCVKCNSIKPSRAHHCSVCQRCVRKMDHHCPWINNCVGEDNQKYFIMFTFYIFLMSAYALYICIHFFILCVKDEWKDFFLQKELMLKNWFEFSPLTKSLLLLSVMFESFIFGLFTLIMCITQLCGIANDRTGIESLVKDSPKSERKSCWLNINTVFNEPFSWRWFCPLAIHNYKARNYENELHVV